MNTSPRALIRSFWWILSLGAFLSAFVWGLNASYPMLGHDFFYAFPHMLAGKWHFLRQGLFPLRFTPFFCGGLPQYGNPQDFFYSLPQILAFFLDVWTSAQLTIVIALIAGYAGWYRFGNDVLRLSRDWSHVLALIIISSGYYFMHMVVGHLTYHILPLTGAWLWLILDRRTGVGFDIKRRSALLGLLTAAMLYSGGYFVIIVSVLTLLLLIPAEFILLGVTQERVRIIGRRLIGGAATTLLLSLSKLVAVWSVLRFLPRFVPIDRFPADVSIVPFFFKSLWGFPQGIHLFPGKQNIWGLHEYSMFLSPIVMLGIVLGAVSIFMPSHSSRRRPVILLGVLGVLVMTAFLMLARGDSLLASIFHMLPVFSSIRVVVRFLYIPVLLLSMLGVLGLSVACQHVRLQRWTLPLVWFAAAVTVAGFFLAYRPVLLTKQLELTFPIDQLRTSIDRNPRLMTQSVTAVRQDSPDTRVADMQSVLQGATDIACYEPLLLGISFASPIVQGPVDQEKSGSFNLRNPACMQYPDENDCPDGGLIKVADRQNFEAFRRGEPVTWHLSILQHLADFITLISLIALVIVLLPRRWFKTMHLKTCAQNIHFWVVRLWARTRRIVTMHPSSDSASPDKLPDSLHHSSEPLAGEHIMPPVIESAFVTPLAAPPVMQAIPAATDPVLLSPAPVIAAIPSQTSPAIPNPATKKSFRETVMPWLTAIGSFLKQSTAKVGSFHLWQKLKTAFDFSIDKPVHPHLKRILNIATGVLFIVFIFWIGSYKLFDRDFWWHIKAGEIMWKTHALIATDPFAFARVGQPYLSTHEWLAQIVMYGIYSLGGSTAIIVWRTLSMLVCFLILLAIDRKNFWINSILAVFAANIAQLGFVERPQLFTYIIFCLFLLYLIRALRDGLSWKTIGILTGLQIIWVNVHGAACFLGIILAGAFLLQHLWDWYRSSNSDGTVAAVASMKRTGWLLLLLCIGILVSPNITETFSFITSLLGDQTVAFIQEWQPRKWGIYLTQTGLLWLPVIPALLLSRKHPAFSWAVVLTLGIMSRLAFRHEMLFAFVAVAVTFDQLSVNDGWKRLIDKLLARPVITSGIMVIAMIGLVLFTRHHYQSFAQKDGLFGYGVYDLARGAEDYVEREHLQGNAFNTYGIGGYLLYRRYPTGKVYIDGRNVDYGLPYMAQTYEAGIDAAKWRELEQKYGFSFALVDYDTINEKDKYPYSGILDKDPTWPIIYLDDWVAVYMKDLPQNKDLIKRDRFTFLTPENLGSDNLWGSVPKEKWPLLAAELKRVVDANSDGAKGHTALAQYYLNEGKLEEAKDLLNAAKTRQPYRAKIYELLAAIAVKQQDWKAAADAYDGMLANAGENYPDLNYSFVSDIYTLAGHPLKAWYYRILSGKPSELTSPEQASIGTPTVTDKSAMPTEQTPAEKEKAKDLMSDLVEGTAQDIQSNNDRGIELATAGDFVKAREAFMQALMLDPGYPVTLSNLCALDLQERKITEAKEYCERALERGKEFADPHYNLALVYLQMRDLKQARIQTDLAAKYGRDVTELRKVLKTVK